MVVEPCSNPKNSPLGLHKVKNDPKIKSNSNVTIQGIIENESCSTTWVVPKQLKNSIPQKDKNDPEIKSNSNVTIQGIIEYESCSITWVDPESLNLKIAN